MGVQLEINDEYTEVFPTTYQISSELQAAFPGLKKASSGNLYKYLESGKTLTTQDANGTVLRIKLTEVNTDITKDILHKTWSKQKEYCDVCGKAIRKYTYNNHVKSKSHKEKARKLQEETQHDGGNAYDSESVSSESVSSDSASSDTVIEHTTDTASQTSDSFSYSSSDDDSNSSTDLATEDDENEEI